MLFQPGDRVRLVNRKNLMNTYPNEVIVIEYELHHICFESYLEQRSWLDASRFKLIGRGYNVIT